MDTLTLYRNIIQENIKKYYEMSNSQPANTTETTMSDRLILDEQRDQYMWLRCGWDGKKECNTLSYTSRFKTVKSGWKKIVLIW